MYASLRNIRIVKMTTERLEGIADSALSYAYSVGQHLTIKFANDYEVSEFVAKVEKFISLNPSSVLTESLTDEERDVLAKLVGSKVSHLPVNSPTRFFAAAGMVSDYIRYLQGIRDSAEYQVSKIEPSSACTHVPFLAKACNYLEALKEEICMNSDDFNPDVAQVVCAGEDLTEF